ncbi:DUF1573 domain-containing protein [Marivirga sp.]|uniref:DUF1573 domain-containing protein n=1 Tax=Marivirga sp. TaxID=2018662 RepID=UPI0025E27EDE|nr:DUF1573 domain-containing protein [Marivirga sp.]
MKSVIYAVLAIGLLSLGACTGDLEKRVTDLERRVAALEGNGGSTATNPSVQTATQNKPQVQNNTPKEKPEGPLPKMEFSEKVHDFGRITEGDVVTKVFTFKNTGEAPLIISDATSSCGCTVPSYTDKPIAPGEEGELEVKYNSRGKKNQDNKVVRITANTWPATNNITIKAFVEPKADNTGAGPVKQ